MVKWFAYYTKLGQRRLLCETCARLERYSVYNPAEYEVPPEKRSSLWTKCSHCGCGFDGTPAAAPSVPPEYSRRGRPVEDTPWHTGWWKD